MNIAILSDIHANFEALERCLQYMEDKKIEYTAVLGDIIGYGADPEMCTNKVREIADTTIIGNHDAAVIGTTDIAYFNMTAREAIIWTRTKITEEDRLYFKDMPCTSGIDRILFTHGSPNNPEEWKYIFNWFDTLDEFESFEEMICFVGHSHIPGIFDQSETIAHNKGPVKLDPEKKYIVNVGSIGQPRDGDPRLSFALLDSDTWTLEIVRLEYDVETARQKIIDTGLPRFLGDRLLTGK